MCVSCLHIIIIILLYGASCVLNTERTLQSFSDAFVRCKQPQPVLSVCQQKKNYNFRLFWAIDDDCLAKLLFVCVCLYLYVLQAVVLLLHILPCCHVLIRLNCCSLTANLIIVCALSKRFSKKFHRITARHCDWPLNKPNNENSTEAYLNKFCIVVILLIFLMRMANVTLSVFLSHGFTSWSGAVRLKSHIVNVNFQFTAQNYNNEDAYGRDKSLV